MTIFSQSLNCIAFSTRSTCKMTNDKSVYSTPFRLHLSCFPIFNCELQIENVQKNKHGYRYRSTWKMSKDKSVDSTLFRLHLSMLSNFQLHVANWKCAELRKPEKMSNEKGVLSTPFRLHFTRLPIVCQRWPLVPNKHCVKQNSNVTGVTSSLR
jgi:hypothetical protein